jgi:predicted O-methyltransferase YrrM
MKKLRTAGRSVAAALLNPIRVEDPLRDVQEATRRHRREHTCGAYAYGDGSLPATLAGAVGAHRIIEVGTALGYTALSMARGAPEARVETIEMDVDHVRLAREQIDAHCMSDRVTVLHGEAEGILPTMEGGAYDVAFFDGFTPTVGVIRELHRMLRPGGFLIAGNLILRPSRRLTAHIADPRLWQTHCLGETALCVKVDPYRRMALETQEAEIACTLESGAMTDRLEEWRGLIESARDRSPIPAGVRLTFGDDAPVDEIARLTQAEQACCSFLSFAITVDGRGVALEVSGPPTAQPLIATVFGAASA